MTLLAHSAKDMGFPFFKGHLYDNLNINIKED